MLGQRVAEAQGRGVKFRVWCRGVLSPVGVANGIASGQGQGCVSFRTKFCGVLKQSSWYSK